MRTKPTVLVLAAAVAIGSSILPADPKKEPSSEFPAPQLEHLDFVVGVWKVEQKWINPDASVGWTAEGSEEITWVLAKHAIKRIYRTKSASFAYEAIGLLTWSDSANRFEGAWVDDASTFGITRLTGRWSKEDRSFVFELNGFNDQGNPQVYKTVDRFESDTVRRATTYKVSGSEVVKISEVQYTRTTPCPAKMRVLFEDS